MKKMLTLVIAILLAGVGQTAGAAGAATDVRETAGAVKVTVTYKGKGTVDGSHKIWVWLFDSPNIGPGATPIDQSAMEKNGGVAEFQTGANQVWVAVAFDQTGVMQGDAPPPPGTPISILMSKDGMPMPVTPGDKAAVVITFDDTMKMP